MYNLEEKTPRENGSQNHATNPSFSSTLLDKIYRSIDEGDRKGSDVKFYTETTAKKQSTINVEFDRAVEEEEEANLRRRIWKASSEKVGTQRTTTTRVDTKSHRDYYNDPQDVLFFSSTSSSSESSSGLLSSSDSETVYGGGKSRVSCFAPLRPKPVRTSVPTEKHIASEDEILIKSKSRAVKIYNNLKKVKQPISPGGKLTSFLNSLFTTGNTKKTKTASSMSSYEDVNAERKAKSGQASTCSSASSFSRSCLSKTSPSSREKLRNGVKRTVRFYPVSVIVGEDCQPCGHKCLYDREDNSLMSVSVPTAWKIGLSPTPTKKSVEEEVMDKSRRVEEAAREFLREYHRNHKILRDFPTRKIEEDEDDDDGASCSSSDLFELDHLAVMGKDRYCEELPVFETTRIRSSKLRSASAIATAI